MSFSFGFAGNEYSEAEEEEEELSSSTRHLSLGNKTEDEIPADPAKSHTLSDLLSQIPLSLAYSTIDLSGGQTMVRRELWDIKHQIMSGSDDNQGDSDDKVMQYMGSDDVIRGVYEGGFKTWECSVDLANHLAKDNHLLENLQTVLELGCGTSLPTLHLFTRALESGKGLRMVIQDYNLPVLQLSTIPSLFLIWSRHRSAEQSWDREGEISISEEDRRAFLLDLEGRGISIQGISGSWSPEMVAMIGQADLIVASETIYSSSNLPTFVQMLRGTLSDPATALVAAKCVYFGVGGGVDEFTRQCEEQKLRHCQVFESNTGVRRTILSIERP